MKKYNELLTEIVGLKSIEDMIFVKLNSTPTFVKEDLYNIVLPMSKTISDRLFGQKQRVLGAHITSMANLPNLKQMEGTQRSLACMTDPVSDTVFLRGVATEGGVVCIVEGYPTVLANVDLYSRVGPQGRRYIPIGNLLPSNMAFEYGDKTVWDKLRNTLGDIQIGIYKAQIQIVKEITSRSRGRQLNISPTTHPELYKFATAWPMLKHSGFVGKKAKAYAIKRWFEETEKIWKKNLKQLELIFDPKHMGKRTVGWNEINLVDIKIKECYIPISIYDSQDNTDYDTSGIEIAGYIEYKEDMSGTKRGTREGIATMVKIVDKVTLEN